MEIMMQMTSILMMFATCPPPFYPIIFIIITQAWEWFDQNVQETVGKASLWFQNSLKLTKIDRNSCNNNNNKNNVLYSAGIRLK